MVLSHWPWVMKDSDPEKLEEKYMMFKCVSHQGNAN